MVSKADNENIIRRVYQSIKKSVICYDLEPGERLNIEVLADELRVSTTPVRESLSRLVAEDLILMVPRMGFFMKNLMESELRDLYELNQVLLDWAVGSIAKSRQNHISVIFPEIEALIERLQLNDRVQVANDESKRCVVEASRELFNHLARYSGNAEINLRVQNVNDRLHYIRACECETNNPGMISVLSLVQLYNTSSFAELRRSIVEYHEYRVAMLPTIIRAAKLQAENIAEHKVRHRGDPQRKNGLCLAPD